MANDWQPIASAPKDGNDVILLTKSGLWIVAAWEEDPTLPPFNWMAGDESYVEAAFTHWMRPEPPQPISGGLT